MNILRILYLISTLFFSLSAFHLCERENEQKCEQCIDNSIPQQNQKDCECKKGYVGNTMINKCYSCLPGCEKCEDELNKCGGCKDKNADANKYCLCKNGFVYAQYNDSCVSQSTNLQQDLFKFRQKTAFKNQLFENLCNAPVKLLENSELYELLVDNKPQNLTFELPKKQIGVAYNKKVGKSLYKKKCLNKVQSSITYHDFNDTLYIQQYQQCTKNQSHEILSVEIENQYNQYFLLMQCQQRLTDSNVYLIIDEFFKLIYQCPINCKNCAFETQNQTTVKCLECRHGFRLEQDRCLYINNPIQMLEINKQIKKNEKVECSPFAYKNNNDYCELCNVKNCKSCSSDKICITCYEPFELENNECICRNNDNNMNCQRDNCLYKDENNNCIQCQDMYFLHENQCLQMLSREYLLCVKGDQCYNCFNLAQNIKGTKYNPQDSNCECEQGYFLNQYSLQCEDCDKNCNTCKDRKNKCKTCQKGFYLDSTVQLCKQCDEQCIFCMSSGQCDECKEGYYVKEHKCQVCESSLDGINVCLKCDKDNICTEAIQGYYIEEQQPQKCIIENCQNCKNKTICKECDSKYYLVDEKCIACPDGCTSCESSTRCKSCLDNYTLNEEDWLCHPCPTNCDLCYSVSSCAACKNGFKLGEDQLCICENKNEYIKDENTNKCEVCVSNCQECESKDKCKVCKPNYEEEDGQCKEIKCTIQNCDTCNESNDQCKKCKGGYRLNSKQQCEKTNCSDQTEPCKKCNEKYYLDQNQLCQLCSSECQNCEKEKDKCTNCNDGFYLSGSACKNCAELKCEKCKQDPTTQNVQCSKCQDGYDLKDTKCYKQNNLFPLFSLLFIIALIYGAFYFKDQIYQILCPSYHQFREHSGIELNSKKQINILD